MQKKWWVIGYLLVTIMVELVITGCDMGTNGSDPSDGPETPNGVDFTNYTTGYSIRVTNLTGERLVAFKGSLDNSTIIGGIPAHATQHGFKKGDLFGQKSEDFPLVLLTETQYTNNKSNLKVLDQSPFTRIFAFFNAQGTNENIYEISGHLGGSYTVFIQNMSSMNVELRLNGITGETVGYAAAGMLQTKLFVNAGDYLFFPVFKKYNAVRDDIITVYPKGGSGNAWYNQIQLGEDGQNEYSLDVSTIGNLSFSTGTAWLTIDNQASDTGIQLQRGGIVQKTATGIATINNGSFRTFQIDMAKTGTSTYASSTNIGAYTLGRTGDQHPIGNFDLEVDKIYKVTVTGSFNNETVQISAPIPDGTVSMEDFEQ